MEKSISNMQRFINLFIQRHVTIAVDSHAVIVSAAEQVTVIFTQKTTNEFDHNTHHYNTTIQEPANWALVLTFQLLAMKELLIAV